MTFSYRYDDGSSLYVRLCEELLENGQNISPRGLPARELRSVQLEITNPAEVHVLHAAIKPDMKRAATEAMQLIGGISSLEQLNRAANGWYNQYIDDSRLSGAYGPRAYLQLLDAERILRRDPHTRQAGITIWSGTETAIQSRDIPCAHFLHFFLRNGKLELDVSMRSNDLLTGFPVDIMVFSCLQRAMAASLGIEPGPYRHFAASLHVREVDRDLLRTVVNGGVLTGSDGRPLNGGMTQIPLPVPYFSFEDDKSTRDCSFSLMSTNARQICLRENDDDFRDREWLIQHVPCLGLGWDFCPLCRYVIKRAEGCKSCAVLDTRPVQLLQVPLDELRKYTGQYVATRDDRVISHAADVTGVIRDLRTRGLIAQAVFKVPSE